VVEVADDAHLLGVRCPDRKRGSRNPLQRERVRPEFFVELVMGALAKQVLVEFRELRCEFQNA